jgi:hypothetical protein
MRGHLGVRAANSAIAEPFGDKLTLDQVDCLVFGRSG